MSATHEAGRAGEAEDRAVEAGPTERGGAPSGATTGFESSWAGPARGLRTHWCGELRPEHAGRAVRVCGWVDRRRDHGEHLVFVDLRDRTGVVQCVVDRGVDVGAEDVVAVAGTVGLRPEGTANPRLATGEVELKDCRVELLAKTAPLPFSLDDRHGVDEALRLRHRYLDLRRPRMQALLRLRASVTAAIRRAMERNGFVEVETPLLWTPTPEGAREFVVPSRLQPGAFYALPQSPQIAKQLLMVAGLDRYYQIARCLRDEDLRADRQFEFTQLDLEASFVGPDEVIGFVTDAVAAAHVAATGEAPEAPARLSFADAIERYGTDKPDLRFGLELVELTPALAGTRVRALAAPCVKGLAVPGGASLPRARLDELERRARALGAPGLAWLRALPGEGRGPVLDGPLARHLAPEEHDRLVRALGLEAGALALLVAGDRVLVRRVLGELRLELGRPAAAGAPHRYAWVVEFPLFEGFDEEGRLVSAHHPFTMPHPDDLARLEEAPLEVRSLAYDLVLDGVELGSGSIRIHRSDVQRRVFAALGIGEEEAEERFGFLLRALRFGAPPHGGFAVGLDRLVALLAGEETIREVIAFPKSQSGADPMTGAPRPLAARTLAELGLDPKPAGRHADAEPAPPGGPPRA
jgi:aspartyl-tRNA synthetase